MNFTVKACQHGYFQSHPVAGGHCYGSEVRYTTRARYFGPLIDVDRLARAIRANGVIRPDDPYFLDTVRDIIAAYSKDEP